ncbi:YjiH family protein [Adlercreutzia sp. R25]|uniref:YjiH family protein n=1 Tax=Adlercreutzia shanghongiae TaxID=3111773 RepID=A0ABU6J2C1_9ACTN|nr:MULTISPECIES: YjiH family protein [unclassified Adlercreutzia]MEC4273512.1 YjiH family protein [Adlercreutzia sp. R25]MEC4295957.1 YjiH family protein [Adlercreutzia sp. R22]
MKKTKIYAILKCVAPSLLGIVLFLVPIPSQNGQMVAGIVVEWLKAMLGETLVPALVTVVVASALLTVVHRVAPLGFIARRERLDAIFSVSIFWLAVRVAGAVLMVLILMRCGPEVLWAEDTGGNMLYTVVPTCSMWYVVGALLLPLLTDYGLTDLFGAYLSRWVKPLFKIPGHSAVSCLSSWLGSSVCGVYLTISQYEKGAYTGREAVIILSCFSLLSISFCSMVASLLGLGAHFDAFYGTIVIAGLLCALAIPRLWPVCRIADDFYDSAETGCSEDAASFANRPARAWDRALERASRAPGVIETAKLGGLSAFNMIVSTLPSIVLFGTLALVLATRTEVFTYLGAPLGAYLSLFGVPGAMEVGSAVLVGFADQFASVVLASAMSSIEARFLIGCLSILQILYMTDIGALILTSKVPFSFWQIFVVYLERVLICTPVVVGCAYLFGIL